MKECSRLMLKKTTTKQKKSRQTYAEHFKVLKQSNEKKNTKLINNIFRGGNRFKNKKRKR